MNPVVDQIFMSHDATFGTNFADDGVSNFSLVERVRTKFGDEPESPREIDVPYYVAFVKNDAIRRKYT
jgi:hypothetical protein